MEEYLDICNSDGVLTGEKATKKEAHDKGLWHRAVHIWILNSKRELLIQKRSPLMDNNPNKWDISTAGHVSAGEDYIISAQREVGEELGLEFKPEDFILIGNVRQMSKRDGYINNEFNPVYIVKKDVNIDDIKKQEDEVSEVKFIYFKELEKIIESKDPSFVSQDEEYKLLFNYLEK